MKNKLILLLYFELVSLFCFAQTGTKSDWMDSLDHMKKDTAWIIKADGIFRLLIERDIEAAKKLSQKILNVANQLQNQSSLALAYQQSGDIAWHEMAYGTAQFYLNKALVIAEEIHDEKRKASVFTSMGINYTINRQENKAAEMFYKSLSICEKIQAPEIAGLDYENLGVINERLKNYQNSEDFHFKALQLFRQINDSDKIALVLNNYGIELMYVHRFNESLRYLDEGVSICEKTKNNYFLHAFYGSLGICYLALDTTNAGGNKIHNDTLLQKSLFNLQKSEQMINEFGYLENMANIYFNMGMVYSTLGNLKMAVHFHEKALEFARKFHQLNVMADVNGELFRIYQSQHNCEQALAAHIQFKNWSDSAYATSKNDDIQQQQAEFETEKQEQQIVLMKSQQENEKLRYSRRLGIDFGLGGALMGFLIVAIIFWKQNKNTKRINTELQTTNMNLKNTQEQLIKSEKMAAFGTLARRVAHEIQNPLNFINNFSDLSEELIKDVYSAGNDEERKAILFSLSTNLQKINHHGKRADSIVKELIEHTRAGTAYEYFKEE